MVRVSIVRDLAQREEEFKKSLEKTRDSIRKLDNDTIYKLIVESSEYIGKEDKMRNHFVKLGEVSLIITTEKELESLDEKDKRELIKKIKDKLEEG